MAALRVLKNRAAQSHLSMRTAPRHVAGLDDRVALVLLLFLAPLLLVGLRLGELVLGPPPGRVVLRNRMLAGRLRPLGGAEAMISTGIATTTMMTTGSSTPPTLLHGRGEAAGAVHHPFG